MIRETTLYGGKVLLKFDPDATRYRYKITDTDTGVKDQPVRGVTTILKDIIAKPDLMRWPMNMANSALFGAVWDEVALDYKHEWKKALIAPGVAYKEAELHEHMKAGARAHTEKSDKGKDVGTIVHRGVEGFLESMTSNISGLIELLRSEFPNMDAATEKTAMKMVEKFIDWFVSVNAEPYGSEQPVYSRKLNYAGTFDMALVIHDRVCLLDLKTTNYSKKAPMGIYPENFLQLGAYSYAWREESGDEPEVLGVVNINKDGKLNVLTNDDIGVTVEECERAFAFALRTHDWLEKISPSMERSRDSAYNPLVNGRSASSVS